MIFSIQAECLSMVPVTGLDKTHGSKCICCGKTRTVYAICRHFATPVCDYPVMVQSAEDLRAGGHQYGAFGLQVHHVWGRVHYSQRSAHMP